MSGPEEIVLNDIWETPRKVSKRAQRISDAKLENMLNNELKQSMYEIERAFRIIAGSNGYGSSTVEERVDRSKGETAQEIIKKDWTEKQIIKYNEWAEACPRKYFNVVLDVVVFGLTLRQVAYTRRIHHSTASMYFKNGLNEYCILQGWGSQIKVD